MIQLRPVKIDDAQMVFEWRNSSFIIAPSTLQRKVTWNEHLSWFKKVVKARDYRMFIIQNEEEPMGQVRFDRKDDDCKISVYLLEEFIGKGYGIEAIRQGCQTIFKLWDINEVIAYVRGDNIDGYRAFIKSGFSERIGRRGCPASHFELALSRILVPHNRLTFDKQEIRAVTEVIKSGMWASGSKVQQLEKELCITTNRKYSVCVGSGLGAIRLSLLALGIKTGNEVIVPAYSCVALANAVMSTGAIPIPVDITLGDWNIDPIEVGRHINSRTKAIISVHTFGVPSDIDKLKEFGIPVIEDCAHALGIEPLGSLGDITVTSFYATKLAGGGEGGAILTDNKDIADFVRGWRDYGDQPPSATRLNDKMTDIEASLTITQLRRLPSMIRKRKEIAQRYKELLHLTIPDINKKRIWYRYVVVVSNANETIKKMRECRIIAEKPVEYWPTTRFPVAYKAYEKLVSLPLYPTLNEYEQDEVCSAFNSIMEIK